MTTVSRASPSCFPTRINHETRSAMTQPEEKKPDALSLADHLRHAARESGLSVYRLYRLAHGDQSTLNKSLAGDRDNLRLDVADRLFRVLGLRVVHRKRLGPGV